MSVLSCRVIVHRKSDSEQEKIRAMVALVRRTAILPLLSHAWGEPRQFWSPVWLRKISLPSGKSMGLRKVRS